MSKFTRHILTQPLMKKRYLQPLWERLNNWTLHWMNYGGGGDLRSSGEKYLIQDLLKIHLDSDSEEPVVFDVGANKGEYALLVKEFIPKAIIYCFEPLEKTFKELVQRVKSTNDIFPQNLALSNQTGSANFYSYSFNGNSADVLASLEKRLPTQHGIIEVDGIHEVNLTTIDLFCEKLKIGKIFLLKIDVEGHELSVLKGADRKLQDKQIQLIQFEFGPANLYSRTTFFDFWSFLSPHYDIFRILPEGIRKLHFYEESREIYLTTNYLAILRK